MTHSLEILVIDGKPCYRCRVCGKTFKAKKRLSKVMTDRCKGVAIRAGNTYWVTFDFDNSMPVLSSSATWSIVAESQGTPETSQDVPREPDSIPPDELGDVDAQGDDLLEQWKKEQDDE